MLDFHQPIETCKNHENPRSKIAQLGTFTVVSMRISPHYIYEHLLVDGRYVFCTNAIYCVFNIYSELYFTVHPQVSVILNDKW
jgi:hypothetical protein